MPATHRNTFALFSEFDKNFKMYLNLFKNLTKEYLYVLNLKIRSN